MQKKEFKKLNMETEKIWYIPIEICRHFGHLIPGVSVKKIRKLIWDGKIKGKNISEGKKRATFYVHIDDINAYLKSIRPVKS